MKFLFAILFILLTKMTFSQFVVPHYSSDSLCDGYAVVNSSGLISWSWTDNLGNQLQNGGDSLQNLCIGNYVLIFDNGTGVQSESFTIENDPCFGLSIYFTHTNDLNSDCSATASAFLIGGNLPITFHWMNSTIDTFLTNTGNIQNLCADSLFLEIIDSNGCVVTTSIYIENDTCSFYVPPTVTEFSTSTSCDASINLNLPINSYTFCYWSTGDATYTINNLCPATYSAYATDTLGCTHIYTFPLINPCAGLTLNLSTQASTTSSSCDGLINATVSGGVLPYTYYWSDSSNLEDAINLCLGTYTLTVTDNSGCVAISSATVLDSSVILCNNFSIGVNRINAYDINTCNGSIEVYGLGNCMLNSFLWSNGDTTSTITNLCTGLYSVSIQDTNNCHLDTSFYVLYDFPLPCPLAGSVYVNDETQAGLCDGTAALIITCGVSPFHYYHSNGDTTSQIQWLCPGLYNVLIVDANSDSLYLDYLVSSDSSNLYYNPYLDSINLNTLYSDIIQLCTLDINSIDTAFVNYTYSNHPDSITVVWSIHSSNGWEDIGASYFVNPLLSGVFTVVLQLYCPVKSGNQIKKIFSEIYINADQLSVIENTYDQLTPYPNPFTNNITINTNNETYSEVKILNTLGLIVYENEIDKYENIIEINGLEKINSGNYIICLINPTKTRFISIVK